MKVIIKGKTVTLDHKDVEIAQKLVNTFLSSIKDNAVSHGKLSMYLTTVAVMYVTGADVLRELSPELAEAILKKEGKYNG